MENIDTDLFVIGGGPAGLVAAIAARRKGLSVAVADCATPPFDKACGEGLMPDAMASLIRLGVTIPSRAGYPFAGIRFTDGQRSVESPFPVGFGFNEPFFECYFMGVRCDFLINEWILSATAIIRQTCE